MHYLIIFSILVLCIGCATLIAPGNYSKTVEHFDETLDEGDFCSELQRKVKEICSLPKSKKQK